jgi:hypothetical protein
MAQTFLTSPGVLSAVLVAVLLCLPMPNARALGGADGGAGAACQADARKLCSGERPGGGRVAACLRQHEPELSAACKAQLPQLVQCSEQIKQVCGEGRPRELRRCLQQNRDKLPACAGVAPQR